MSIRIRSPKKLIEVALPLDAINAACAHEKQPGIGAHPRGLHLWWARRPLPASRAVLFSQLVNDPGYQQGEGFKFGVSKAKAAEARERLFKIIEDLVLWENTNNESVLSQAQKEIEKSWKETCELNRDHPQAEELFNPNVLPAFHDPFSGGGAIPLEAQRLGLKSYASDLNPVAVTINKAMIEIPPVFSDRRPVGKVRPDDKQIEMNREWKGASGLAEDVRRYGYWVWNEAQKLIGHLYPQVEVTSVLASNRNDLEPLIGNKLNVIGWVWARTVKSPSPAYSHVDVPLVSNFILSSKAGKEAYVEPVKNSDGYSFIVKTGSIPAGANVGTTAGKRAAFICLMSGSPIDYDYIRSEGKAGRMGQRLMAIIAEGKRGKIYLSPTQEQIDISLRAVPAWKPEQKLPHNPRDFKTPNYGLTTFGDLFTPRQLVAMNTFCDLVKSVIKNVEKDAVLAGLSDDGVSIEDGGSGAKAYSQAIGVYLAFAIDRLADYGSSIATWKSSGEQVMQTYKRQAIPMTWDFPESNFLGQKAICWLNAVEYASENLNSTCPTKRKNAGVAIQADAQTQQVSQGKVISTDPPYYDNIGYADLSEYFYVWLRRSLHDVYPKLFNALTVPKDKELVATPYRHGGKTEAESFFLKGMKEAIQNLVQQAHPAFPVTIYYAFKQNETEDDKGTSSTGWETFLQAVVESGVAITGTWPMRTELSNRMIASGTNALASSVVLVCRKRASDAPTVGRREFIRELNAVLPAALDEMTRGGVNSPIAPVDLSQAIIGPGMEVFTKYSAVLEADGKPMSVKTALRLINRFLAEEDFDHDTQFCLQWFDHYGWSSGKFGDADVLARAKGTSVDGLREGGVVESSSGTLRLLKPSELSIAWRPETDSRVSIWELLHQMIARFYSGGESGAGELLAKANSHSEAIRTLAYRLYTTCERKGWAQDASSYDGLVRAWDSIESAARAVGYSGTQIPLFDSASPSESQNPINAKSRKKK